MNPYLLAKRRLNFFERIIHASYPQLFLLWIDIILVFTAAYFSLSLWLPAHAPTITSDLTLWQRAFDSLYFSMVTATTIGYGDIVPLGFSKLLAMIQSSLALLVFTVLVGKLVSQRQELLLHEVHKMTFEGVFYHIRHVLFIVRKDFDELIHKAQTHSTFTETDWDNLGTAYLQAHSLIEEIPDLYGGRGVDLHTIDLNREKLLFESVHRTLMRIHTLLTAMTKAKIAWEEHAVSLRQLKHMTDTVDSIMVVWKVRSPYHDETEFEDIRVVSSTLHEDIKKAIH